MALFRKLFTKKENLEKKAEENKGEIDGRTLEISKYIHPKQNIGKKINNNYKSPYPIQGNLMAAISAAIEAYLAEERRERQESELKLNRWRLSGFQDSMNIRQLWQQRVRAVAGGPVGQSAYPLLKFHYH